MSVTEELEKDGLQSPALLEGVQDKLKSLLKPFQKEQNHRQKKLDFMKQYIRGVEKEDFFLLAELLTNKQSQDLLEDSHFEACLPVFADLKSYAEKEIDNYRIQFKGALMELAEEAGLPIEVDFPRIFFMKGIEAEVDFGNRETKINSVILKSVDPRRIISAAMKKKRQLYDSPYDPQTFIDNLFSVYSNMTKSAEEAVSSRLLYQEYVLSLQSKTFFQNMEKAKFKGYSLEQFSVDLWRFFQSSTKGTSTGGQIKFSGGRGPSLWLIDSTGVRRQITHLSFMKENRG